MEKKSHYFIVGIFVSISLLALTMFVIWLAGTHDTRHYHSYTIYFRDPVSGLKNGAVVQYRGVDVGRVKDVRLSGSSNNLIKVDVEVDESTPISRSSQASLATTGFTGIVYIELTTGEEDTGPAERLPGEEYPVIEGRGTQLSKLFQDVPAISKQVLTLTERLNSIFDEESVKSLNETFANIEKLSRDMKGLVSEENIENTTIALRNLTKTSEDVSQLSARFNKTADEIDKAVNSLNAILTDNKGNINRFAGDGLNQITEMTRETRAMARSIRRLADRLEQDPSKLIYQPNYRGVEIQK